MKTDLVKNACLSMQMLMALWSDFKLSTNHLDVLINMLIQFEFAYVVTPHADVEQEVMKILCEAKDFPDLPDKHFFEESTDSGSSDSGSEASFFDNGENSSAIGLLMKENGKLLLPWLLDSKRPDDIGSLWATDCPLSSFQVIVKYSFVRVYSVPRGVFERLSCRCHHHASYVSHWRSGFVMRYGCVTLFAHTDERQHEVMMIGRVSRSNFNLFRLYHVMWRCVQEMETILLTVPGALLDRYITTKKETKPGVITKKTYKYFVKPPSSYSCFYVDDFHQLTKTLEKPLLPGIQTGRATAVFVIFSIISHCFAVVSSVSSGVPLSEIFSTDCGAVVDQNDLKCIAQDVGDRWKDLSLELDTDIDDIADKQPPSGPSYKMLQKWSGRCQEDAMICVLSDALCACGLAHIAGKYFGHIVDVVLKKHTEQHVDGDQGESIN